MIVSKTFYNQYVKFPRADEVPTQIYSNPKFFPFFEGCLGAVDGTHINAFIPSEDIPRYRNRKGGISQNVLAACTFDLRFCYVLSGWEGSAADGRVFEDARRVDFAIPPGSYYLADLGFVACDALLIPFRSVRYHLREWALSEQRQVHLILFIHCTNSLHSVRKHPRNCSTCAIHLSGMRLKGSLVWPSVGSV